MQDKINQLIAAIRGGDVRALARAITLVENDLPGSMELLGALPGSSLVRTVGITGPPGAGKSSLVNSLIATWLGQGLRVCVLAVDPSSPFNMGALLGDRIRMTDFYTNPRVYIRSLASRGALGGLSSKIIEVADIAKLGSYDYLIIETVGVGQSEVEIAGLADCSIVVLVPEAGDMVQTMKAGIMEIANLFVLNKADREGAEAMYRNLLAMVHERDSQEGSTPVLKTTATTNAGIEDLAIAIDQFFISGQFSADKRLLLLTDKAWHLIQSRLMASRSRVGLRDALAARMLQPDFNLYRFVAEQATVG